MKKVTVAMPVYNDSAYLRSAINSILSQSFTDFELLIINDGSTDNCPEIIRNYKDPRIRVLTHPVNLGRPASRNDAIKYAQGEYLLWMDADDIALPELLATQVDFLDSHPEIDISGVNIEYFHGKNNTSNSSTNSDYIRAYTLFSPCVLNPGCCLRLNKIRSLCIGYDNEFLRAEDFVFWFTSQFNHELKITSIPKILMRYRYFYRKTNTQYHELVVKKYIFPFLHLEDNDDNIKLHTRISLDGVSKTCNAISPAIVIDWLNIFYHAGIQCLDEATAKEFKKIIFQKIYEALWYTSTYDIISNRRKYAFLEKNIFSIFILSFFTIQIKNIKNKISAYPKLKKIIIKIYRELHSYIK